MNHPARLLPTSGGWTTEPPSAPGFYFLRLSKRTGKIRVGRRTSAGHWTVTGESKTFSTWFLQRRWKGIEFWSYPLVAPPEITDPTARAVVEPMRVSCVFESGGERTEETITVPGPVGAWLFALIFRGGK